MDVPAGGLIRDRSRRERGYGRVLDLRGQGFALVAWPGEDPRELRVEDQTDLVRGRLHPGQRVRLVGPGGGPRARGAAGGDGAGGAAAASEGVVLRSADDASDDHDDRGGHRASAPSARPWSYAVALGEEERVLSELALEPIAPGGDDPQDSLTGLVWRGSKAFAARLALLRTRSRWYEDSYGIPAFLGARIVPLPHQLHAARRVLTDRVPRFVLADEVGLGKTIEAGLVLQALAAADPQLRVLVIAPGAMSRQWLCELFLRFGEQVFVHLDAPRAEDPDLPELLAAPRVIASTTALEVSPELRTGLLEQRWDVVVVDEAHQAHPDAPLYGFLRELARAAPGLLALSATPAKSDVRGLLGLLGLIAPEAHDPEQPARFAEALEAREAVAVRLDAALGDLERGRGGAAASASGGTGAREHAAALAHLLAADPHVAELAERVAAAAEDTGQAERALEELLAYVQEHHRIDRRIIRTRRATVRALGTALAARERVMLDYEAPPAEVALVAHIEAAPASDGPSPLQDALRGLLRRRACAAPLPLLALLEERRAALAARAARATKKGGGGTAPLDFFAALGADPGPDEEHYLFERVVREAPPLPGEAAWLTEAVRLTHAWMVASPKGCARTKAALRWIRRILRGGQKVLVFAQDREAVEAFSEELKDVLGPDTVGAIHYGLEEHRLAEVALRFQQAGDPLKVLVSDELGGEGRNFQVAAAILHLDQPWAVGRIEQRIGRLDRIGRPPGQPVRSVLVRGPSPTERALVALHGDVLEVYERSLGGLELLLPELHRRTAAAACAGADELTALAGPLGEKVAAERARADEAYERALDVSARRLEEASEQAEVLGSIDGTRDADSIAGWAKRVGIGFKPLGDDLWDVSWKWEHLRRTPPGLAPAGRVPTEGRMRRRGTFSRVRALGDESLDLFGPGHPLVDALVRDLLGAQEGRTAALTRALGPEYKGHAYLLVVAGTSLVGADLGGDLPVGLAYRAQAHLWPQARTQAVRLRPGGDPQAVVVTDRPLLEALETPDRSDRTLDPDDLARSVDLPALWAAVRAGVAQGLDAVRAQRRAEVDDAATSLTDELADEMAYLRGAAARGSAEERAAAAAELAARERLVAAVRGEGVALEALALVIGTA